MNDLFNTLFGIIQQGYNKFQFSQVPKIIDRDIADPKLGELVSIVILQGCNIEQRFLDSFIFQISADFEIEGKFSDIEKGALIGKEFLQY